MSAPRSTTWPRCTRARAATPRPSRCTSAASRSARRRWGPTTPTSAPRSTTWPAVPGPGPLRRGRAAVQAQPRDPREGAGARPPRCRPRRSTTWPRCTEPRAATPRPSRSTSAASRIREKALGPDHPDVGTSLNNLAVLYESQGRYAEAEPLLQAQPRDPREGAGPRPPRCRHRRSTTWPRCTSARAATPRPSRCTSAPRASREGAGPRPPRRRHVAQQPGRLYQAQGRYAEAEPLYKRSLAIREKALGPDHPAVGTSLNNLAALYFAQRDWARAADYWRRSTGVIIRRAERGRGELGAGPDRQEEK